MHCISKSTCLFDSAMVSTITIQEISMLSQNLEFDNTSNFSWHCEFKNLQVIKESDAFITRKMHFEVAINCCNFITFPLTCDDVFFFGPFTLSFFTVYCNILPNMEQQNNKTVSPIHPAYYRDGAELWSDPVKPAQLWPTSINMKKKRTVHNVDRKKTDVKF